MMLKERFRKVVTILGTQKLHCQTCIKNPSTHKSVIRGLCIQHLRNEEYQVEEITELVTCK